MNFDGMLISFDAIDELVLYSSGAEDAEDIGGALKIEDSRYDCEFRKDGKVSTTYRTTLEAARDWLLEMYPEGEISAYAFFQFHKAGDNANRDNGSDCDTNGQDAISGDVSEATAEGG